MKHAYLIMAHNEFEVLQKLICALDDERNDIFIHFDKKNKSLPNIYAFHAKVVILKNRVDIRWGHITQIEAEYLLFEEAIKHDSYLYYHLISGVHLPLYSQNYIHDYFLKVRNQQVFSSMSVYQTEIDEKLLRYNILMKTFEHKNTAYRKFSQIARRVMVILQNKMGVSRNRDVQFYKASNWVSITEDAVRFLITVKSEILKKYKYTMCADEFFVPTALINEGDRFKIRYENRLLKYNIHKANAQIFTDKDFELLLKSECLFARKFSTKDLNIADQILNNIR